jgi:Cu2+-exporting ATPase
MTPAGEERLGSAVWCGVEDGAEEDASLWFKPAGGEAIALRFEDRLRADAAQIVARLKAAGFGVELLSGDRRGAVAAMARAAGIEVWRAQQTPAQKIARLDQLKAAGHKILMVGDGLNDAPALAAGHASLSPSTAADISQTTADAIFQGRLLEPAVEILNVARSAHALALQNFAIAIGYNLVFVPMAVVGWVTPLIAAVAMSASSIAVTANAVRLRRPRSRSDWPPATAEGRAL